MVKVAEYIAPDSMTSNIIGRKLPCEKIILSRLIDQIRYATIAKNVQPIVNAVTEELQRTCTHMCK